MVILSLLAGLAIPRVRAFQARARDARRIQDLAVLQQAIEAFRQDRGRYPAFDAEVSGWDSSSDGDLASELITESFLRAAPRDPLEDGQHSIRYRVYPMGSHGCFGPGPYYVLGLQNLETDWARERFQSHFACPANSWEDELAYSTGGGATFTAPGPPSGPGL